MFGWFQKKFPFGIDVADFIPEPQRKLVIAIEGGETLTFDPADEPVFGLITQANVASTGIFQMMDARTARKKYIVTGWNPETRELKVRIEK